jgi:hypothetical protein
MLAVFYLLAAITGFDLAKGSRQMANSSVIFITKDVPLSLN